MFSGIGSRLAGLLSRATLLEITNPARIPARRISPRIADFPQEPAAIIPLPAQEHTSGSVQKPIASRIVRFYNRDIDKFYQINPQCIPMQGRDYNLPQMVSVTNQFLLTKQNNVANTDTFQNLTRNEFTKWSVLLEHESTVQQFMTAKDLTSDQLRGDAPLADMKKTLDAMLKYGTPPLKTKARQILNMPIIGSITVERWFTLSQRNIEKILKSDQLTQDKLDQLQSNLTCLFDQLTFVKTAMIPETLTGMTQSNKTGSLQPNATNESLILLFPVPVPANDNPTIRLSRNRSVSDLNLQLKHPIANFVSRFINNTEEMTSKVMEWTKISNVNENLNQLDNENSAIAQAYLATRATNSELHMLRQTLLVLNALHTDPIIQSKANDILKLPVVNEIYLNDWFSVSDRQIAISANSMTEASIVYLQANLLIVLAEMELLLNTPSVTSFFLRYRFFDSSTVPYNSNPITSEPAEHIDPSTLGATAALNDIQKVCLGVNVHNKLLELNEQDLKSWGLPSIPATKKGDPTNYQTVIAQAFISARLPAENINHPVNLYQLWESALAAKRDGTYAIKQQAENVLQMPILNNITLNEWFKIPDQALVKLANQLSNSSATSIRHNMEGLYIEGMRLRSLINIELEIGEEAYDDPFNYSEEYVSSRETSSPSGTLFVETSVETSVDGPEFDHASVHSLNVSALSPQTLQSIPNDTLNQSVNLIPNLLRNAANTICDFNQAAFTSWVTPATKEDKSNPGNVTSKNAQRYLSNRNQRANGNPTPLKATYDALNVISQAGTLEMKTEAERILSTPFIKKFTFENWFTAAPQDVAIIANNADKETVTVITGNLLHIHQQLQILKNMIYDPEHHMPLERTENQASINASRRNLTSENNVPSTVVPNPANYDAKTKTNLTKLKSLADKKLCTIDKDAFSLWVTCLKKPIDYANVMTPPAQNALKAMGFSLGKNTNELRYMYDCLMPITKFGTPLLKEKAEEILKMPLFGSKISLIQWYKADAWVMVSVMNQLSKEQVIEIKDYLSLIYDQLMVLKQMIDEEANGLPITSNLVTSHTLPDATVAGTRTNLGARPKLISNLMKKFKK